MTPRSYFFLLLYDLASTAAAAYSNNPSSAEADANNLFHRANFLHLFDPHSSNSLQNFPCPRSLIWFTLSRTSYHDTLDSISATHLHVHHNPQNLIQLPLAARATPRYRQLQRTPSHCHINLILLPTQQTERDRSSSSEILGALTTPTHYPPVALNRDWFIFLLPKGRRSLFGLSKFLSKIKYSLILSAEDGGAYCTFCAHCTPPLKRLLHSSSSDWLSFPDHQRDFGGSTLRVSTTDKVPQLLELVRREEDGVVEMRRGVYASVLSHTVRKLNFTYKLLISSGLGSTGTQLKNGTWLGIVGDVFRGEADIGFMAAVTYERYKVADICAPINFAYIGFATGPPTRIYSWRAIFWPYSAPLWMGFLGTLILAGLATKLLLLCLRQQQQQQQPSPSSSASFSQKEVGSGWSTLSAISLFFRSFVEQGDEMVDKSPWGFRLFLSAWLLSVVVLSTAYKSKMVAFMTFPVKEVVPETLEQLLASSLLIDFHYFGNVGSSLFETSNHPTFVGIVQKMRKLQDPLLCLRRALQQSKSACIIFQGTFEELIYRNVSDASGKSQLTFWPYTGVMWSAGVIHTHGAPLSRNFKGVIYTAMEMGLIPHWQQEDFKQILRNKNTWMREEGERKEDDADADADADEEDVLTLKNLRGSFAIFCVGAGIATFAFIGEWLSNKGRMAWVRMMQSSPLELHRAAIVESN